MEKGASSIQESVVDTSLPGDKLDASKMPGHWLLARMGKTVLRPGGIELTHQMLNSLAISSSDTVVELAPGLGTTARVTLAARPGKYIAVENDKTAAERVRGLIDPKYDEVIHGDAANTKLPNEFADVIYGEAMLTMQMPSQKTKIFEEAYRVLRSGGRYAIHELGLMPDDLDESTKKQILKDVSDAIRVGARPLTVSEWQAAIEEAGFRVPADSCVTTPMHLLELRRLICDEGLLRAARIALNVMRTPVARRRILAMRRVFRLYKHHLCAIHMIGHKP